jgi:plastocyanin
VKRTQWLILAVLVPLVAIGGLLLGRNLGNGQTGDSIQIGAADDATRFEYDYVIPPGTAARIAAGEAVEIVPAELDVKVGDAIRIVNNDSHDHVVGVFFVAAGETLTQRFKSPGVLAGNCSVHPSGKFTLRVVEA